MKTTRRQIMMFAGGSAAGALFSPAPWRLITDTALWSENWPGIPVPARGEIRTRHTNCAICSAGCAVRARCVVDQPVQLSGVPSSPLSHGALCPFGIAGHHLPYHPARVRQGPVQEATAAVADGIAKCGPEEHIVALDLRPGRTASWSYRRAMAAIPKGVYAARSSDVAVDLTSARTVLSFGVPVLDGWGTPGNVIAARPGFHLIQVEAVESRTASLADRWIQVRPGTEDALAQGLAGSLTLAAASQTTGVSEADIASIALELVNGPTLVLGTSRLESTGRTVLTRRDAPVPDQWHKSAAVTEWDSIPDGSVRVLLIDEAFDGDYRPWNTIERKLASNPVVVAFAATRDGYGRHAQYLLPTAVYPEVATDIPPAIDSVAATFRLSAPLLAAPADVINPEQFITTACGLPITDTLRERADAIHRSGRGELFTYADGQSVELKTVSADDFWKSLNAGGCWIDETDAHAVAGRLPAAVTPRPTEETDLPLVIALSNDPAVSSSILSKLYQESNLRLAPGRIAMNPTSGFEEISPAVLQTVLGKCAVTVTLDPGVPPGIVQVASTPAILDMCTPGAKAKVVRS